MAPGAVRHTVHAHCATWKHLTVLLLRFAVIQLQTNIIHGCCALSAQRCMASWLHARELQFRLCSLDQWLQGTGTTPYTMYSVYTWTQQLTIATAANCHIKANCTRTDSDVKTTLHTLSWFFLRLSTDVKCYEVKHLPAFWYFELWRISWRRHVIQNNTYFVFWRTCILSK